MYVIHDHPDELAAEPEQRFVRTAKLTAAGILLCAFAVSGLSAFSPDPKSPPHADAASASSSAVHSFAYTASAPATIGSSTRSAITWTGNVMSDNGKEKDVIEALAGFYQSGLAAVRARLGN